MKSIIHQLYDGQLFEAENIIDLKEREQARQQKAREQAREKFFNSLSDEQKNSFEHWELFNSNGWSKEVEAAYVRGFKIGALLAFEVNNVHFDD